MKIKQRLVISNVLMILVPVVITLMIAAGCIGVIWFNIARGTGLGFEDSEAFKQASSGISQLAEEAMESPHEKDRQQSLAALSSFLDRGTMSLIIEENGTEYYRYGDGIGKANEEKLKKAAATLNNECAITSGKYNLCAHSKNHEGAIYTIYLYNIENQLSYDRLKITTFITGIILILTILLSVFFTDRFLTRFVVRHIEEPIELLSDGVQQISDGNLEYRLEYTRHDEFLSVCEHFNDMAQRLQDSVEHSRREEESRKELMAGISHDLRSPLTSIQAYVEGLLDGVASTPSAQHKYLTTIKSKAEELERMVAKILAYSKMEIEETSCNSQLLQLDECLTEELKELSEDFAQRGLSITSELTPFTVVCDKEELRQILINIAENSLKYKTKEHGNLKIKLTNEETTGRLIFADDGPGVSSEALPKLFDIFYRTDPARNDPKKGSGVGLAIVKKAVLRMGGSVEAKNGSDGGLIIEITLPKGDIKNAEDTNR